MRVPLLTQRIQSRYRLSKFRQLQPQGNCPSRRYLSLFTERPWLKRYAYYYRVCFGLTRSSHLQWYARLWKLHPFHDTVMANAIGNKTATHWWYRFLPTEANRALKTFKEGYKAFNIDIIAESERVRILNINYEENVTLILFSERPWYSCHEDVQLRRR